MLYSLYDALGAPGSPANGPECAGALGAPGGPANGSECAGALGAPGSPANGPECAGALGAPGGPANGPECAGALGAPGSPANGSECAGTLGSRAGDAGASGDGTLGGDPPGLRAITGALGRAGGGGGGKRGSLANGSVGPLAGFAKTFAHASITGAFVGCFTLAWPIENGEPVAACAWAWAVGGAPQTVVGIPGTSVGATPHSPRIASSGVDCSSHSQVHCCNKAAVSSAILCCTRGCKRNGVLPSPCYHVDPIFHAKYHANTDARHMQAPYHLEHLMTPAKA
jgi:hypothetical protein